jgi:hypothetical protein
VRSATFDDEFIVATSEGRGSDKDSENLSPSELRSISKQLNKVHS